MPAKDKEFWGKYNVHADTYDKYLLEGWNGNLDVLLIFASHAFCPDAFPKFLHVLGRFVLWDQWWICHPGKWFSAARSQRRYQVPAANNSKPTGQHDIHQSFSSGSSVFTF